MNTPLVYKLGFCYSDLIAPAGRTSFAYFGNFEYQISDRLYDALENEASASGVSIDLLFKLLITELQLIPSPSGSVAQQLGFAPDDLVNNSHKVIHLAGSESSYKISDRLFGAIVAMANQNDQTFVMVFSQLRQELK